MKTRSKIHITYAKRGETRATKSRLDLVLIGWVGSKPIIERKKQNQSILNFFRHSIDFSTFDIVQFPVSWKEHLEMSKMATFESDILQNSEINMVLQFYRRLYAGGKFVPPSI